MKMTSLLADAGSTIAYYPDLVPFVGSINAALTFSQIMYWMGKESDPEGWIRKESKELQEETGLTKDQQEAARKRLRDMGIIEEKRKGIPPKIHFRIKVETLIQLWEEYRIKRGDSPQLRRKKKVSHKKANTPQHTAASTAHITESTQEITQKSTPETGSISRYLSDDEERERGIKLKEDRPLQGEWQSIGHVLHERKSRSL